MAPEVLAASSQAGIKSVPDLSRYVACLPAAPLLTTALSAVCVRCCCSATLYFKVELVGWDGDGADL